MDIHNLTIKTQVIHINQAPKDWMENPQYVYIGRSENAERGYFGNPFHIGKDGTREEVLWRYHQWIARHFIHTVPNVSQKEFRERVRGLQGKTLVCFCSPKPCHGDILALYAELRTEVSPFYPAEWDYQQKIVEALHAHSSSLKERVAIQWTQYRAQLLAKRGETT